MSHRRRQSFDELAVLEISREELAKRAFSRYTLANEMILFMRSIGRPEESLPPRSPKGMETGAIVVFMDYMMTQDNHLHSELRQKETTTKAFEGRFSMFGRGEKAFQYYHRGLQYAVLRDGTARVTSADPADMSQRIRDTEAELQHVVDMMLLATLKTMTVAIAKNRVAGAEVRTKKASTCLWDVPWPVTTEESKRRRPSNRYVVNVSRAG